MCLFRIWDLGLRDSRRRGVYRNCFGASGEDAGVWDLWGGCPAFAIQVQEFRIPGVRGFTVQGRFIRASRGFVKRQP